MPRRARSLRAGLPASHGLGMVLRRSQLGTALRLHENDATGNFQRLLLPDSLFGTSPAYHDNWSFSMWARYDAS